MGEMRRDVTTDDFPALHASTALGDRTLCGRVGEFQALRIGDFVPLVNHRHRPSNLCGACADAVSTPDEAPRYVLGGGAP